MSKYDGKKFGRLTVIKTVRGKKGYWCECQCDCGNIVMVNQSNLGSGNTKSCGCLKKELLSAEKSTHGESKTRLYHIWKAMRKRCTNPYTNDAHLYRDRGITVCDEWQDYSQFSKWARENGYSDELTIDRIDPNGNYTPDNCRWATWQEQARNKRDTICITIGKETKTLTEWCEEKGVLYGTALHRFKKQHLIGEDLFRYQKPRRINIFTTAYGGGDVWAKE